MLPPKKNRSKQQAQQSDLLACFAGMNDADRQSLLAFAQFLVERAGGLQGEPETDELRQPEHIPRPAKESVVKAMRRLADTYPMLNKDDLLHQASALMGGHIMQGEPAPAVIDKLERLFADAYQRYAEQHVQDSSG